MTYIIVLDSQLFAESLSLLIKRHTGLEVLANPSGLIEHVPQHALMLIELFLPNYRCGLRLAKQIQHRRPDLTTIVWTTQPTPIYIWAAVDCRISGFLDKNSSLSESMYWMNHALKRRAAWPGHLLDMARDWNNVALLLRTLTNDLWKLWAGLLCEESNSELASQLCWSKRTFERRLSELFVSLNVGTRADAINRAWKWGLINTNRSTFEWSSVVLDLFYSNGCQTAESFFENDSENHILLERCR